MLKLYTLPNFKGREWELPFGEEPDLRDMDNLAMSCRSRGYSELFPEKNFMGPCLTLFGKVEYAWLGDARMNLMISSARTEG